MTRISATFRDREDEPQVVHRCFTEGIVAEKLYFFRHSVLMPRRTSRHIPLRHFGIPRIFERTKISRFLACSPNARKYQSSSHSHAVNIERYAIWLALSLHLSYSVHISLSPFLLPSLTLPSTLQLLA